MQLTVTVKVKLRWWVKPLLLVYAYVFHTVPGDRLTDWIAAHGARVVAVLDA